ncbi:MAG: DMT family transporter [Alphaproteobacteria bacterium]|nr:DMT family transporter [Alphaproteobacteria bacterium]
MTTARDLWLANGALVVMTTSWAAMYPVLDALLGTWDPLSATVARMALGGGVLFVALLVREGPAALRGLPIIRVGTMAFLGVAVSSSFSSVGVQLSGGIATAITATMSPILAAVMARYLSGVAMDRAVAVGAGLAVTGGFVVVLAGGADVGIPGLGELLVLISNGLWVWYSIAAQRWCKGWSQLRIAATTVFPGGLFLLLLMPLADATGILPTAVDWSAGPLALALLTAVMVAVANPLWHFGVKHIGVTVASMYGNLVPIIAVLVAMAFGSYPNVMHLVGGVLVMAGVVYAQTRSRPRVRATPP